MRILLTGANGFIGSHLLEGLLGQGFDVAVLLRPTSDTQFIDPLLPRVDVRYGDLDSPDALRQAARAAEIVIHCAAKTKAMRKAEYRAVNAEGTRNLLEACSDSAGSVRQLIFLSSLAASGPGSVECPATEDAEPRPVSAYGRSKLLAEQYIHEFSRVPYTIMRPAAVYGPRDRDLFVAFRATRNGLMPMLKGGRQPFSNLYVGDLVRAVLGAIDRPACLGGTYHLAHPVPCTHREMAAKVAEAMERRPLRVYVPGWVLYPVCFVRGLIARITSRPGVLNLEKIPELTAPGWVCSTARAARDLDFVAPTELEDGVRQTLAWYETNGWLREG